MASSSYNGHNDSDLISVASSPYKSPTSTPISKKYKRKSHSKQPSASLFRTRPEFSNHQISQGQRCRTGSGNSGNKKGRKDLADSIQRLAEASRYRTDIIVREGLYDIAIGKILDMNHLDTDAKVYLSLLMNDPCKRVLVCKGNQEVITHWANTELEKRAACSRAICNIEQLM